MKSFIKFILVLFVCVYFWQVMTGPEYHVVIDSEYMHSDSIWLQALMIPVLALVGMIVLFVLFSVFGAILVSFVVAGAVLLFVGLSMFWPTLLAIAVCYWLFTDNNKEEAAEY